jgi:hypothetical protein
MNMKKLLISFSVIFLITQISVAQVSSESKSRRVNISKSKPQVTSTQLPNTPVTDKVVNEITYSSDVDSGIPLASQRNNMRFALIIGNEDYNTFQTELDPEVDVDFAKHDAKIFKEYAVKTLGIPENQVFLELNAGSIQMQRAIKKLQLLIKNSNGQAEVFFYYAGHGFPDEQTKEPYLIPVDVNGSDLEFAIKLNDVYAQLTEYPSERITVFLDACFSGGARNQGLLAARGIAIKPKENTLNGNIVVFSASSGDQSALANKEKYHGMFTYYLLDKLKSSQGELTYLELYEHLVSKVGINSVLQYSKEQNPKVSTSLESKDSWTGWEFN